MWKDDNDKINEVLFKLNEAKFPDYSQFFEPLILF
jgi:hypothetical protein